MEIALQKEMNSNARLKKIIEILGVLEVKSRSAEENGYSKKNTNPETNNAEATAIKVTDA